MPFISISIDICGSTDAKARLLKHSGVVGRIPTEFYAEYQNRVMSVEDTFWTMLRSSDLDINRLFLIKSIGDEIWYSYDLSELHEFECHEAYARMIEALLALQTKSFDLMAGPKVDPYDWENDDPDTILQIDIFLKITIDLITDALDTGVEREKYLMPRAVSLLSPLGKPSKPVYAGDDELIKLSNRLGIASQIKTSEKLLSLVRSDYIGWEIDRFFRLTKLAIKDAVLIGPEILSALDSNELIPTNEKQSKNGKWTYSRPKFHLRGSENLILARRYALAKELKGVGTGCNIGVIYSKWQKDMKLDAVEPKPDKLQTLIATIAIVSTSVLLLKGICNLAKGSPKTSE